jgi:hypothetical protein
MKQWIEKLDWKDQLNYTKKWKKSRPLHKHEQLKYRVITWIENYLLDGRSIFGYSNWDKIK